MGKDLRLLKEREAQNRGFAPLFVALNRWLNYNIRNSTTPLLPF